MQEHTGMNVIRKAPLLQTVCNAYQCRIAVMGSDYLLFTREET